MDEQYILILQPTTFQAGGNFLQPSHVLNINDDLLFSVSQHSSRTSVWRIAEAYLKGPLKIIDVDGRMKMVTANHNVSSTIKELIVVKLKEVLEVSGWCRTRWSDETRALQLTTKSRIEVSAKKVRRWLREISGVRDSDLARSTNWHTPPRSEIRSVCDITFVIADQLDLHRLPNVGYE